MEKLHNFVQRHPVRSFLLAGLIDLSIIFALVAACSSKPQAGQADIQIKFQGANVPDGEESYWACVVQRDGQDLKLECADFQKVVTRICGGEDE